MQRRSNYLAIFNFNHWVTALLFLFLATDIGFIFLHLIHSYTPLLSTEAFSLEIDRGYSEIFQYTKEYWIALILGFLAVRNRSLLYLSWSLLFVYLLLDDAFKLHETLGALISQKLGFTGMFNLSPENFGELISSVTVGLFFLLVIATTYRLSNRSARNVSKQLTLLLFTLAFFGIVMDMLHRILKTPAIDPLLVVLEDGGELVVMSLIACFVFSQSLTQKIEQSAKRDFVRHS